MRVSVFCVSRRQHKSNDSGDLAFVGLLGAELLLWFSTRSAAFPSFVFSHQDELNSLMSFVMAQPGGGTRVVFSIKGEFITESKVGINFISFKVR